MGRWTVFMQVLLGACILWCLAMTLLGMALGRQLG
jgi:hypothetical protein